MSDTDSPDDPDKRDDGKASSADPIIGQAVGSRLKSLFDEFTSEDVPDRFLDLIGQLEQNEKAQKGDDAPTSEDDADTSARDSGKADT